MDDHRAITDLLHRYAECIDTGDLEGLASLFEHATYTAEGTGRVLTGRDEVLAAQGVVQLYDGTPRTHHDIGNIVVSVDGDDATSRCYFTVLHAPPGSDPRVVLAGRYRDRFERVEGAWRFTERVIHMDLIGDLSTHIRLDQVILPQTAEEDG